MSHAPTEEELLAAIHESIVIGGANTMRQFEASRGHQAVFPGEASWLPAADWPEDIVVTRDGNRVRIVAIYAKEPGCGVFSRLVSNIIRSGLVPVVIAPMGEMVDILTGWGWHRRIVGSTFQDRCDEWFPTRKWRQERVNSAASEAA